MTRTNCWENIKASFQNCCSCNSAKRGRGGTAVGRDKINLGATTLPTKDMTREDPGAYQPPRAPLEAPLTRIQSSVQVHFSPSKKSQPNQPSQEMVVDFFQRRTVTLWGKLEEGSPWEKISDLVYAKEFSEKHQGSSAYRIPQDVSQSISMGTFSLYSSTKASALSGHAHLFYLPKGVAFDDGSVQYTLTTKSLFYSKKEGYTLVMERTELQNLAKGSDSTDLINASQFCLTSNEKEEES